MLTRGPRPAPSAHTTSLRLPACDCLQRAPRAGPQARAGHGGCVRVAVPIRLQVPRAEPARAGPAATGTDRPLTGRPLTGRPLSGRHSAAHAAAVKGGGVPSMGSSGFRAGSLKATVTGLNTGSGSQMANSWLPDAPPALMRTRKAAAVAAVASEPPIFGSEVLIEESLLSYELAMSSPSSVIWRLDRR